MCLLSVVLLLVLISWWVWRPDAERCILLFREAYADHLQLQEDNEWLRAQCSSPPFVARMQRQGSQVCEEAFLNRPQQQQSALWVGVKACVQSDALFSEEWRWRAATILMLLAVAAPSLLLPRYRARRDRREAAEIQLPTSMQLRLQVVPHRHYCHNVPAVRQAPVASYVVDEGGRRSTGANFRLELAKLCRRRLGAGGGGVSSMEKGFASTSS